MVEEPQIYQRLAEVFHQPVAAIVVIAEHVTTVSMLKIIEQEKRQEIRSPAVERFEQALARHCASLFVSAARPGWDIWRVQNLSAQPGDTRRLFLVESFRAAQNETPEGRGTDLVAVLPDGSIHRLTLDAWPSVPVALPGAASGSLDKP